MTSLTEIRFVRNDFNLENTINENNVLKKSNTILGISLTIVLLSVIGVLITSSFTRKIEDDTKKRN